MVTKCPCGSQFWVDGICTTCHKTMYEYELEEKLDKATEFIKGIKDSAIKMYATDMMDDKKAIEMIRTFLKTIEFKKDGSTYKTIGKTSVLNFYKEVCKKAEDKMMQTGKLEGSHYAAMNELVEDYR